MSEDDGVRQERLRRSLDESGVFLVREMSVRLARFARSRGLDEPASEEIVQEAFLAIWANGERVAHPEAWLVRVVDRRCSDWHRRRRARERAAERVAERHAVAGCGSPRATADTIDLVAALAKLSARMRLVVQLRYVEGLGSEEAAARLGYSPASYRSTLSRALAALRVLLGVAVPDPRVWPQ